MSSISELLSQSQGRQSFMRLNIGKSLRVKADEKGNAGFMEYRKSEGGKGEVEWSYSPISGVFLGNAMKMEAFDDNLGAKGGTYRTSYYFKKDQTVTLFAPKGDGYGKIMEGKVDDVEAYIQKNSTAAKAKKIMSAFVWDGHQILEIETNLSLGIDQLKQIGPNSTTSEIVFTPRMYSRDDKSVSRSTKEVLGKLADRNPPAFVVMSVGAPIQDDPKLVEAIRHFQEFKADRLKGTQSEAAVAAQPASAPVSPTNGDDLPF